MGAKNKKKKENTTSKPISTEKIVEEQTQTEEIKEEIVEELKEEQIEQLDDSDLVELDLSVEEPIRQREKRPKVVILETYNKVKDYVINHIKKIPTKDTIKERFNEYKAKLKDLTFEEFCVFCANNFTKTTFKHGLVIGCIAILGGMAVYSYAFARPQQTVEDVNKAEETVASQNYYVDIDVDKVDVKEVEWTKILQEDILHTLMHSTYINIKQTADSANKKGTTASAVLTTDLKIDFNNKRVYGTTDMSDNIGNKHSEYFYDNLAKLYLTYTDEEGWVKSRKVALNANFDLDSYQNCADFFKFLYRDFAIAEGTKGKYIDDYVYFDYTRDATDSDLTNINYDKLDTTDIHLIFQDIEGKLQPVSMVKEVNFESNDNVYSSRLVIYFEELSKDYLGIPEYIDYEEETEEVDGGETE